MRGGVDVSHARAVTRRIPPILRADACQHDVRLSGYPNRYTVMKSALALDDFDKQYSLAKGQSRVLGRHPDIEPIVVLPVQAIVAVVGPLPDSDLRAERKSSRAGDKTIEHATAAGRDERITPRLVGR